MGDEGAGDPFAPVKLSLLTGTPGTLTSYGDTRDTQPPSVNVLHGHLVVERHKVPKIWIGNPIGGQSGTDIFGVGVGPSSL